MTILYNHPIPFIFTMGENQYKSLRTPEVFPNAPDMLPQNEIPLSRHPAEIVTIFTAEEHNRWAWGYRVCWANGQTSYRNPSFSLGVFQLEHDAILYGIGFMKSYSEYFQSDTVDNIRAAERRHSATTLPLFDEP